MLFIIAAALTSCNKDKTTPDTQPLTTADLPALATDYIYNNYPDATIEYVVAVSNSVASYLVTLNTAEELAFTKTGGYLGDGAGYHHGKPGDDSLHCDTIHGGGHHGGGHHGGGHHGGGQHGTEIPIDSLPTAITDFITASYSGYIIRHAELDSLCPDGLVTEVMICLPGSEPVKLVFDAGNTLLVTAGRIPYADVPQAVKDFITANYAGYKVSWKAEKFTLADSTVQYMIWLKLDQTRKSVRIKEDGTLVCES